MCHSFFFDALNVEDGVIVACVPRADRAADVTTLLRYVTSVAAAEGEGFEPPRAWRPLRFSRPLRSTTPASLRGLTQPILWATAGLPNRADAPRQARR